MAKAKSESVKNESMFTPEEIEKKTKTIKNFGGWAVALGILAPIATALVLLTDQNSLKGLKDTADWIMTFGDVGFMILMAVVFIILGRRLQQNPHNKTNGTYILILTIMAIATIVLSFVGGGAAGIFWFILAIYGFVAKSAWNKLNQDADFREKLTEPNFKLGKWFWGIIIGLGVILFGYFFAIGFMEGFNEAMVDLNKEEKISSLGTTNESTDKRSAEELKVETSNDGFNWQIYADEEAGFSYLAPSEVEVEKAVEQSSGTSYINNQYISLGSGEDFYMVQFNEFDTNIEEIDGMLEVFVEAILTEYPDTEQNSTETTFAGHPALEFKMVENDAGTTYYYDGKAVAVGEKLYLMMGMSEEKNSSAVTRFLNSLQIDEK